MTYVYDHDDDDDDVNMTCCVYFVITKSVLAAVNV